MTREAGPGWLATYSVHMRQSGMCMRVYYYYYAYIHRLTLSNATARCPCCIVARQVEDIAIEVTALAVVGGSRRDISVRLLCWHKRGLFSPDAEDISSSMCSQYSPLRKKTLNNLHFSQHSCNKTESSMRIPFLCHISILV